jgi:hypothetical protein
MPGLLVRIMDVALGVSGDSLNTLTAKTLAPGLNMGAMSTLS